VLQALETVRPYMESHGGDVQLVQLTDDGFARLRLEGSCHGCSASRATLESAITRALEEHCPDLAGLEVGGVLEEGGAISEVTGMALPMAEGELARAAAGLGTEPVCLPVIRPSGPPLR
jgi:Fe-S cluster biogenesis protein NfuA